MKFRALLVFIGIIGLSSAHAANTAEKAFRAGHYEYAYAQWKKVLSQRPEDRMASEGLERLQAIAKDLYDEAVKVSFSDPDRKKDLLRTVILISDPSTLINRQARKVLGDDL